MDMEMFFISFSPHFPPAVMIAALCYHDRLGRFTRKQQIMDNILVFDLLRFQFYFIPSGKG